MVGLVLVSHSAKLAEGVRDLVVQMEPDVPLAIAGGTDDGELGTSLELVTEAIAAADGGDGAIVLFDLGSAEMTAESAVEFLDEEQADRILVVDAPLVEGAIAAAGAAGGGAVLGEVATAAARTGPAADQEEPEDADGAFDHAVELTLTNVSGLHARPAGKIARAVRTLDAEVQIARKDTGDVASAASTLRLVSLAAPPGTTIVVRASGPDAEEALDRITEMVDERFGEPAADG